MKTKKSTSVTFWVICGSWCHALIGKKTQNNEALTIQCFDTNFWGSITYLSTHRNNVPELFTSFEHGIGLFWGVWVVGDSCMSNDNPDNPTFEGQENLSQSRWFIQMNIYTGLTFTWHICIYQIWVYLPSSRIIHTWHTSWIFVLGFLDGGILRLVSYKLAKQDRILRELIGN